MTDGARQVSFSNQNFFPLLSSLLPSKHEQKHASNKQKKLLEGVGKKKTKTFPAQNLKIALSLHWNQRQFSSFQAPLLSLSSAKATKSFRKKKLKSEIKKFSLASLDFLRLLEISVAFAQQMLQGYARRISTGIIPLNWSNLAVNFEPRESF